jgi:hypothetical protein
MMNGDGVLLESRDRLISQDAWLREPLKPDMLLQDGVAFSRRPLAQANDTLRKSWVAPELMRKRGYRWHWYSWVVR